MTTPLSLNTALNANLPMPPAAGDQGYGDIFQAFFKGLPAYKQQQIWATFVQGYNFQYLLDSTNAPLLNDLNSTDPDDVYNALVKFSSADLGPTSPYTPAQITAFQNTFKAAATQLAAINASGVNQNLTTLDPLQLTTYLQGLTSLSGLGSDAATFAGFLSNAAGKVVKLNKQAFLDYVGTVYKSQQFETLSPEEVQKRAIMQQTFDSLINMLLNLQSTISVEGNALTFYGNWQDQYTKALAKVPVYVGGTSSLPNINVNDLSKFTFGYDNISVEDIAANLAQQLTASGGTSGQVILKNQPFVTGIHGGHSLYLQTSLIITTLNLGGPNTGMSISLKTEVVGVDSDGALHDSNPYIITPPGPAATFSVNATTQQRVDAIESGFLNWYQNQLPAMAVGGKIQLYPNTWDGDPGGQAQILYQVQQINGDETWNEVTDVDNLPQLDVNSLLITPIPNGAWPTTNNTTDDNLVPSIKNTPQVTGLGVAWLHSFVAPAGSKTDEFPGNIGDQQAKTRTEINSRDQQYIENLRSFRQDVQNLQTDLQSKLDQSRQTITQQTDLISSIIDSLKGIISSIFR